MQLNVGFSDVVLNREWADNYELFPKLPISDTVANRLISDSVLFVPFCYIMWVPKEEFIYICIH